MHLILFEDSRWSDLAPVADVLPVPALAFGATDLATRWQQALDVEHAFVEARAGAMACWRDRPTVADVAPADGEPVVCVNAACIPGTGLEDAWQGVHAGNGHLFVQDDRVLAALLPWSGVKDGLGLGEGFEAYLQQLGLESTDVEARTIEQPWQMVEWNITALEVDLVRKGPGSSQGDVHPSAVLVEPVRILIDAGATVGPLAVLDASEGPIHLEEGVRVAPHTHVRGPCVVRRGTHLLGGVIGRSTIGPHCRIAGEMEDCIWQGRSNKRHHGFVGHSIIGEWCNLGALTTTSDLKNNYGPVRVRTRRGDVDSGTQKLGAMLGAHVKTGIGTLLPTGAWVGVGANVFGGGRFAPKHVPAFAWWNGESTDTHRFDAFLGTARIAMSRRGARLGEDEAEALARHFEATAFERRAAGSPTS